jgi:hypothetical protein
LCGEFDHTFGKKLLPAMILAVHSRANFLKFGGDRRQVSFSQFYQYILLSMYVPVFAICYAQYAIK